MDALLPAHREFLKKLFAEKKLLICGRLNPRVGGVIIANIHSRDEFEKILKEDPFTKAGVSEYQIIEFIPTMYDDRLKEIIS